MPDLSVRPRGASSVHPLPGQDPEPSQPRRDARQPAPGIARTPGSSGLVARHLSRATSVAASAADPKQVQQRLETYFDQMSGPYTVGGKQIRVPADFRMEGGLNQASGTKCKARIEQALARDVYQALSRDIGMVAIGKGTPAQVRRVTQALIDSPAFKPYAKLPPEKAVRHMAWDYGVGVDCSGYVHSAFLYSRGSGDSAAPSSRYGLGPADNSKLQSLPGPFFRHVAPAEARPGDVIKLTSVDEPVGHKVIVMANDVLDGPIREQVAKGLGSTPDARIHVITVASSWGAGGNPDHGGVDQRLWAFDESSGRWASVFKLSSGNYAAFPSSQSGPYDHKLDGVFRPRSEK